MVRNVPTTKNRMKTKAIKSDCSLDRETKIMRKKTKQRQVKTTKERLACSPNKKLIRRTHNIVNIDMGVILITDLRMCN